jgi:Flp pilus assembly protein TadB
MLVGDRDRDRAAGALRDHYARGYLTLEEFSQRLAKVLTARSRADLLSARSGMPLLPDPRELIERARFGMRTAVRGALLAVFTAAYFMFCTALLLVLAVTLLIGVSASILLVFLAVWLVPTVLLARLWRRPRRRSHRRF